MALHEHSLAHSICSSVLADTHHGIAELLRGLTPAQAAGQRHLLDIGCWDGSATVRYAELLDAEPSGIEVFEPPARDAEAKGVSVKMLDLERDRFPWEDASFDVVVANQVFEHLKNIWLPFSEVYRVLRPDGYFVISVPNLASLHNRVLLALGSQPTSIRAIGPHVRGYTLGELAALLTLGDVMICRQVRGVGFYPLPAIIARPLARVWAGASHTIILVAQKVRDLPESPWQAYAKDPSVAGQTFYA